MISAGASMAAWIPPHRLCLTGLSGCAQQGQGVSQVQVSVLRVLLCGLFRPGYCPEELFFPEDGEGRVFLSGGD